MIGFAPPGLPSRQAAVISKSYQVLDIFFIYVSQFSITNPLNRRFFELLPVTSGARHDLPGFKALMSLDVLRLLGPGFGMFWEKLGQAPPA